MLDWRRSLRFGELLDYYKGLIALRKSLPGLCDKSSRAAERITGRTVRRVGGSGGQIGGGLSETGGRQDTGSPTKWLDFGAEYDL